jgi:hypothetical protein
LQINFFKYHGGLNFAIAKVNQQQAGLYGCYENARLGKVGNKQDAIDYHDNCWYSPSRALTNLDVGRRGMASNTTPPGYTGLNIEILPLNKSCSSAPPGTCSDPVGGCSAVDHYDPDPGCRPGVLPSGREYAEHR